MSSQPEVDAQYCLQSAWRAANGDFGWADDTYFQQWGYQIPLVMFEAAILRVFGSVNAVHAANVLASLITGFCLYRIADVSINNKRIATCITSMFLLMPSNIIRLGNPYNQTFSAMFVMLGVLLWVKHRVSGNLKSSANMLGCMLGTGVMLALGKLFRSDGIILLIAIMCWYVFHGLHELTKGKRWFKGYIIEILVLLGAYCVVTSVVDWAVIAAGINSFGIDNNCPYWAIVCGLTPNNFGSYHARFSWLGGIIAKEEQKAAFIQVMREIFNEMDLRSWMWFYFNKIYNMWVVEEWYFGEMGGMLLDLARAFEKSIYFVILNLGLVSGVARGLECRNKTDRETDIGWLFMIAYIGFFLIYLVVESVVRYRYLAVTILFALSAKGMQDLKYVIRNIGRITSRRL